MARLLPVYLATALVLGAGGWLGTRMGRWSPRADLESMLAAARVDAIPSSVAGWTGKPEKFKTRELEVARARWSYWSTFTKPGVPGAVSVMVLGGEPGPIAVHTPDICFVGAGQTQVDPVQIMAVPDPSEGGEALFKTSRFRRSEQGRDNVGQALWAWCDGGPWSAPENPRIHFALSGALYKLYVVRDPGLGEQGAPKPGVLDEETQAFLAEFLPALRSALFPKSSPHLLTPAETEG